MTVPDWIHAHREFRGKPFDWRGVRDRFHSDDVRMLRNWGAWMLALWDGTLAPQTDAQRQFVEAARDQRPAVTELESLFRLFLMHAKLASYTMPNMQLLNESVAIEKRLKEQDEAEQRGSALEEEEDFEAHMRGTDAGGEDDLPLRMGDLSRHRLTPDASYENEPEE